MVGSKVHPDDGGGSSKSTASTTKLSDHNVESENSQSHKTVLVAYYPEVSEKRQTNVLGASETVVQPSFWLGLLKQLRCKPKVQRVHIQSIATSTVLDAKQAAMELFNLPADTPGALSQFCLVFERPLGQGGNIRLSENETLSSTCMQLLSAPPSRGSAHHRGDLRLLLVSCTPSSFCLATIQNIPVDGSMWRHGKEFAEQRGITRSLLRRKMQVKHGLSWFDCVVTRVSDSMSSNRSTRLTESAKRTEAAASSPPPPWEAVGVQLADGLVLEVTRDALRSIPAPGPQLVTWFVVLVVAMLLSNVALGIQAVQQGRCTDWCFAGIGYSEYGTSTESGFNRTSPTPFSCTFGGENSTVIDRVCLFLPPEIMNRVSFLLSVFGQTPLAMLYLSSLEAVRAPLLLSIPGTIWFFNWCVFLAASTSTLRDAVPLLAVLVGAACYGVFVPVFQRARETVRGRTIGFMNYIVIPCVLGPLFTWTRVFSSAVRLGTKRNYAVSDVSHFNATVSTDSYSTAVLQLDADVAVAQLIGPLTSAILVVVFFKVFECGTIREWRLHWFEQLIVLWFGLQNFLLFFAVLPFYPDFWFSDGQGVWPFAEWWWQWNDSSLYLFTVPRLENVGLLWALQLIVRQLIVRLRAHISMRKLPAKVFATAEKQRLLCGTVSSVEDFAPLKQHPAAAIICDYSRPFENSLNQSGVALSEGEKGYIRDLLRICREFLVGKKGGQKSILCSDAASIEKLKAVVNLHKAPHRAIYEARMLGLASDAAFWPTVQHIEHAGSKLAQLSRRCRQPRVTRNDVYAQLVSTLEASKVVYPSFNNLLSAVSEKTSTVFEPARMKGLYRIAEKLFLSLAAEEQHRDRPVSARSSSATTAAEKHAEEEVDASLRICDIVRGMIVCSSMNEFLSAVDLILSLDAQLTSLLGKFELSNFPCTTTNNNNNNNTREGTSTGTGGHICSAATCHWLQLLREFEKTETGIQRIVVEDTGESTKNIYVFANNRLKKSVSDVMEALKAHCKVDVRAAVGGNNTSAEVSATAGDVSALLQGRLTMSARASGMAETIVVTRIKNRLISPSEGGWADIAFNFYFPNISPRVMCELQIVHKNLLVARVECQGHHAYARFRTAQELLISVQKNETESAAEEKTRIFEYRSKLQAGLGSLASL